jgi:hypothetical protein
MGAEGLLYKVFVKNPVGKRPLGRLGSRWEDGIRIREGAEWIKLAQDNDRYRALMNTVMNLRVLVE